MTSSLLLQDSVGIHPTDNHSFFIHATALAMPHTDTRKHYHKNISLQHVTTAQLLGKLELAEQNVYQSHTARMRNSHGNFSYTVVIAKSYGI